MEQTKRTTKMKNKKLISGIAMVPLPVLVFLSIDEALFQSGGFLFTLKLAILWTLVSIGIIVTTILLQNNQKTITLKVKK
ncbi:MULTISPECIES: hypothetical protein [Flavobacteriaceae]|jgi:hypothetical protein|uniref:Uncharacterized protein n=1 Tax=Autumnicola musiva TaxID=3075589 RepID=A0ABU3D2E9_9FLAO|nr:MULTISPECIES: hypothetical protein [Flavobacteriaceae]MDT0675530.1 hypothetical protein [Zunongwangia sp. F117]|tara:strand:- start:1972 stop:2211 length:240 start_codon:yes stop_codon:yes gene_type:complete